MRQGPMATPILTVFLREDETVPQLIIEVANPRVNHARLYDFQYVHPGDIFLMNFEVNVEWDIGVSFEKIKYGLQKS